MIVSMKKIHVVILRKDWDAALNRLRDLGTVHVEHQDPLEGYQLEERREEVEILTQTVEILNKTQSQRSAASQKSGDWSEIVNKVLKLSAEIGRAKENIAKRHILIQQWEPWEHFDPQDIEGLARRGIFIQLCARSVKDRREPPAGVILQPIFTAGGLEHCAVVSREKVDLPFDSVALPPLSLKQMRIFQEEEQLRIVAAEKEIEQQICYLEFLENVLAECRDVLNFEEVAAGMKEEGPLVLLKGFCPEESCGLLERDARDHHWALSLEDPAEGDHVPTLVRTPRWARVVQPLFQMINVVPGYHEMDVSVVFLFFFALFVGMLIGDAGYGALLGLMFGAVHWRVRRKLNEQTIFYLIYFLCGCTIFWGILTGTYFGQQWLPQTIQPVLPWLTNDLNIQRLCFLIAAVHLSIAHVWRTISRWPSLSFLGQAGWLILIWGMYFVARTLVLSDPFPPFAGIFLTAGPFFVIFFSKPTRNILKTFGAGLGEFLLNVINSFTDIVSYIRLYAVGLATVAVADAANEMSFFWIIFLHALNVLLAAMAILVHGVRLNVLEFSGHLGMEWAGFRYQPFRKKSQQQG